MAIQCKYCGTELPKDDARFCTNCGMLVPSHPFSPQSLSALKNDARFPFSTSPQSRQEEQKHVLHEQKAEWLQTPSTQDNASKQDRLAEVSAINGERDVDIEHLDTNELSRMPVDLEENPQEKLLATPEEKLPETPKPERQRTTSSPSGVEYKQNSSLPSGRMSSGIRRKISGPIQLSSNATAWPQPVTHVSVKSADEAVKDQPVKQSEYTPIPTSSSNKAVTEREFHIGVWDNEEMRTLTEDERQEIEGIPTRSVAAVPVEDVPTRTIDAPVEDMPTQAVAVPSENQPLAQQVVEQSQMSPFLSVPSSQTAAQERIAENWHLHSRAISGSADPSLLPIQPAAAPFTPVSGYQPENMQGTSSTENGNAVPAPAVRRPRKKWPVVIMVVLLLIVLAAGGVGALMLTQHPNADPIAQSQVSFSDTQLGLSLLYPNGWIKQIEAGKSTAHFYASDHIGQVDVLVAGSGDVKQALHQQATKLGMSGVKDQPALNFAGASWQQVQGNIQQEGANYTETVLATLHSGKLFIIVQHAPQNNYTDWEKEFFAPLRASFKFL